MSLILAVEPDRRQAGHLTQVVRQRVGAELILAETTELALASIGNRVPDLILVPALLSPQDDAALAAALRVIATAAHVQMLTTPMFAATRPEPRSRGVLAAFRRSKPKAALDGCDPAEFAQQIASYLEAAAEERATAKPPEFEQGPFAPPIAEPVDLSGAEAVEVLEPVVEAFEPIAAMAESEQELEQPIDEPIYVEPALDILTAEPAIEALAAEPAFEAAVEPALEAAEAEPAFEAAEVEPALEAAEVEPALEAAEVEPAFEAAVEPAIVEPVIALPEVTVDEDEFEQVLELEPAGLESVELVLDEEVEDVESVDEYHAPLFLVQSIEDESETVDESAVDLSADLDQLEAAAEAEDVGDVSIVEAVEDAQPATRAATPIDVHALADFAASVEALTTLTTPAHAAWNADVSVDETVAVAAEADGWEVVERREPVEPSPLGAWRSWTAIEGMVAEAADTPVPAHVMERAVERAPERPEWVQLVESLRIDVERRRGERPAAAPPPARMPARPIQDEWGLFDPTQCGFAALLAKLDEITTTDSRTRPSA